MKKVLLVCNAHIDPVWQWKRDEGIAAALATFHSAAALAEEFDFVFCHNEALLYEWIERYDPELFERIRNLIARGKWKIMGGWYLQPDCNLPSAESMIRQIGRGRAYFSEKFGVAPNRTAANLDSFGHSFGLPQILRKAGFDSYVCTRPMDGCAGLPRNFVWEGVDGSRVRVLKLYSYNNEMGEAAAKIRGCIAEDPDAEETVVLWGVGNHGGGPSRKDLSEIEALAASDTERSYVYGLPEKYFEDTKDRAEPVLRRALYPCFPGCYVSQSGIKRLHRKLENELYAIEKISVAAAIRGGSYPLEELARIERILLFSEFHDILPGTSVRIAAEESMRSLSAGIDRASAVRASAMLSLCGSAAPAGEGEYPIFVCNPHPYPIRCPVEAPVMLAVRYFEGEAILRVFRNGEEIPAQNVKEDSNIPIEWAKKVLFSAELPPCSVVRFEAFCEHKKEVSAVLREVNERLAADGEFVFDNGRLRAVLRNGLLASLTAGGRELLGGPGFLPAIFDDNEDPWAMQVYQSVRVAGAREDFRPADPAEAAEICGTPNEIPPMRIVEFGSVAVEVEAYFVCRKSTAVLKYRFYRDLDCFDLSVETVFQERSKILKLILPCMDLPGFRGQIMAGIEEFPADGSERAAQRWVMRHGCDAAITVVNDGTYGVSSLGDELELSLLRTPAYTAHYIDETRPMLKGDRYVPRSDLGEHRFSFRILAGKRDEVFRRTAREAQVFNEPPAELNLFPYGRDISGEAGNRNSWGGESEHIGKDASKLGVPVEVFGDSEVVLNAMKARENGEFLFRLGNESGEDRNVELRALGTSINLQFKPFEIKTVIGKEHRLEETGGLEI